MGRDRILILFAPAGIDHRLEEAAPAQLYARTRTRTRICIQFVPAVFNSFQLSSSNSTPGLAATARKSSSDIPRNAERFRMESGTAEPSVAQSPRWTMSGTPLPLAKTTEASTKVRGDEQFTKADSEDRQSTLTRAPLF